MKFILNILLYLTQKLHMKLGGQILVSKDEIILQAPKGRHWEVPNRYNIKSFRGKE